MARDITRRILGLGAGRDLICEVLLNRFNRSSGDSEVLVFGDQDDPQIVIKWAKNGNIKTIAAHQNLNETDLRQIESAVTDALVPGEMCVFRYPIFSNRPVGGAIGFEQWFQIFPAASSVPQPTNGWGGYVANLEVVVADGSLPMLAANRAYEEAQRIELVLSALSIGGFRLQSRISQSAWVVDPLSEWKARHLPLGFLSPETGGKFAHFSSIDNMPDFELVTVNGYFDGRVQGAFEYAVLPDTFPMLALKFKSLSVKLQAKFLRAARWTKHMDEVWNLSRSAAYVAAISAIEALLPQIVECGDRCEVCGHSKNLGATRRFSEFVDQMVDGAISKKDRSTFYNQRSRIVHGDTLALNEDVVGYRSDPRILGVDSEQRRLSAITRIVLHNWLVTAIP